MAPMVIWQVIIHEIGVGRNSEVALIINHISAKHDSWSLFTIWIFLKGKGQEAKKEIEKDKTRKSLVKKLSNNK